MEIIKYSNKELIKKYKLNKIGLGEFIDLTCLKKYPKDNIIIPIKIIIPEDK